MKPQNLQVGDLSSAEGSDRGADQASTTMTTQEWPSAVEYLQQRTKPLNLVAVAFCGLGLAAAAALTLLSWSDRVPTPPPLPGIAGEPSEPAARAASEKRFSGAPCCQFFIGLESRWIRATALDAGAHRSYWLRQPQS